MAGKIFINYRRKQTLSEAQFLASHLQRAFGTRRVFLDVRGIDGFSDWFDTLKTQVEGTAAMISIIGKDWLSILDRTEYGPGQATKDFVRFEISEALRRNIPVLPVLLDGASMPDVGDLPLEMRGLLRRLAIDFHAKRMPQDAAEITSKLRRILAERPGRGVRPWTVAVVSAAALAAGVAFGPYVLTQLAFEFPFVERRPDGRVARAEAARDEALAQLQAARAAKDAAEKAANDRAAEAKRVTGLLDEERKKTAASAERIAALSADLARLNAELRNKQREIDGLQKTLNQIDGSIKDVAIPKTGICPHEDIKKNLAGLYNEKRGFGFSFFKDDDFRAETTSRNDGRPVDKQPALLERVQLLVRNPVTNAVLVSYAGSRNDANKEQFCGWVSYDALVKSLSDPTAKYRSFTDTGFDLNEARAADADGWNPRPMTMQQVLPDDRDAKDTRITAKVLIQSINTDAEKEDIPVAKIYDKPGGAVIGGQEQFNIFPVLETKGQGLDRYLLLGLDKRTALGWIWESDLIILPSNLAVYWKGTGKGLIYSTRSNAIRKRNEFYREPDKLLDLLPKDRNIPRFPILGPKFHGNTILPDIYNIAFTGVNTFSSLTVPLFQKPPLKERPEQLIQKQSLKRPEQFWLPQLVKKIGEDAGLDPETIKRIYSRQTNTLEGWAPTKVDGVKVFDYFVALDRLAFTTLKTSVEALCERLLDTTSEQAIYDSVNQVIVAAGGDYKLESGMTFQEFFSKLLFIPAVALKTDFMKQTPKELFAKLQDQNVAVADKTEIQKKICRFSHELAAIRSGVKVISAEWDGSRKRWQTTKEIRFDWVVKPESGLELYYIPLSMFP